MYGKIFSSMYNGTLRGKPHQILVFTNMISCCDKHGVVDKHPQAIADEIGLTLEEVKTAISSLEAPDPESRSPAAGGARIERISDHRSWGWRIVNYEHYRDLRRQEDRAEQNRLSQKKRRERIDCKHVTTIDAGDTESQQMSSSVSNCHHLSASVSTCHHLSSSVSSCQQLSSMSANAYAYAYAEGEGGGNPPDPPKPEPPPSPKKKTGKEPMQRLAKILRRAGAPSSHAACQEWADLAQGRAGAKTLQESLDFVAFAVSVQNHQYARQAGGDADDWRERHNT